MQNQKSCANAGFSLVELIVVIAIMAILAAIAIPTFAHFIRKANEATDIDFMNQLERALTYVNADVQKGEIVNLKVYVDNNDGSIVKIEYTEKHLEHYDEISGSDMSVREEVYEFKRDGEQNLSDIIDWDYKFKALDSVTDNPGWKDTWIVDSVTQKQPWEE